jgi:1,4-dihydroxy-2-naphthoate octaprenyltransferase
LLIALSLITALIFHLRFHTPWYFLAMVLVGNLLANFYAAPPLRLAYRGPGEVSTMFAAGILTPGMGYICAFGSYTTTSFCSPRPSWHMAPSSSLAWRCLTWMGTAPMARFIGWSMVWIQAPEWLSWLLF